VGNLGARGDDEFYWHDGWDFSDLVKRVCWNAARVRMAKCGNTLLRVRFVFNTKDVGSVESKAIHGGRDFSIVTTPFDRVYFSFPRVYIYAVPLQII